MTWNYRIIDHGTHLALHEVFYDAEGRPSSRTEEPVTFVCDPELGPDDITRSLDRALYSARGWPMLKLSDFASAKAGVQPELSRKAAKSPSALEAALEEVARAVIKFPTWPTDPIHALALLGEAYGELTKALLQSIYEPDKTGPDNVQDEAVKVAAMALRFLASVGEYSYQRAHQHIQPIKAVHWPLPYFTASRETARPRHPEDGAPMGPQS